jgi:NADP-dependent 3-hydroxy acid dehydrogenase YdfG
MAPPSKSVLITGCSSGIGHATALHLLREGWTVHATARRPETLSELQAAGANTVALDVTDEASMQAAVEEIGPVGALVNNAGYSQSGAVETIAMDALRAQFETNVFGLVRLSQLVLPGMRAAGAGRIVNIGSMGGKLTFPGGGAYHATKYAVEALSDALRFEVAGFGVQVVLIEPGLITSEFAAAAATALADGTDDTGPYAKFNAAVGTKTTDAYAGPMAKLGGPPEAVAKVIAKALSARRPRPRYTVTPSAKIMLTQRALMTDRAWDRVMRSQFPTPRS